MSKLRIESFYLVVQANLILLVLILNSLKFGLLKIFYFYPETEIV